MTTENTKRSFDFKRTDQYLCDPLLDLCLVGGAGVLPDEQSGELDTSEDKGHPLYDPRLRDELTEPFVRNIDHNGVTVPVVIVKLGDLACVVDGRQRVRAARVANRRRTLRGEPPLKVPCVIKRTKDNQSLLSQMIGLNENRHDDDPRAKLDKLRRLMDSGVTDPEQLGEVFGVSAGVIEQWLRFDDLAIERVQQAVNEGKLAMRAGMEISRLRDPAKQAAALDAVLASPPKTGQIRRAREAAKLLQKPTSHVGVADKRTQRALLQLAKRKEHAKGTSKEALAWWQGVEDALTLIVGGDDTPDDRLLALLGEASVSKGGK